MVQATRGLHCSFCAKHESAVAKIIAGPGIYICDECVALCNAILSEHAEATQDQGEKPRLPMWESMTDEEILAHIPRIAVVESQVEGGLRDWVQELRRRGVTWERIGSALGMTRQSAWGRFSGEE